MTSVAVTLAGWAAGLEPGPDDLDLAAARCGTRRRSRWPPAITGSPGWRLS